MLIARLLRSIFMLVVCLLLAHPILALDGTVTDCSIFNDTNAGDGSDTLGELLPGGGTITFACGGSIIVPEIIISTDTILNGNGQTVTLNGNYAHGIFVVNPNIRLELIQLTVRGGRFAFIDNQLTGDGAGLHNDGGTVIITNSIFTDNGDAEDGGGIFNNNNGTMTITGSTFTNNRGIFGGALANDGGTVTITGSTFTDNVSYGAGAGVINDGSDIMPASMTITNSTFTGNHAMGSGGAIQNHGGNDMMTITNTTLTDNRAGFNGDPGVGGAVDNEGILTINNSSISNNFALDGGGLSSRDGTVEITNTTFFGNSARFGGGIYNTGGSVTVTGSIFTDNASFGAGGGVINDGSNDLPAGMTITNSLFSGNHAMGSGGAIQNGGADTMTISNTTISGNRADSDAGGITNSGILTITYSTLSGNVAPTGHAGGFQNFQGTTTITNSLIANSSGGDCLRLAGTIILTERNLIEDGSCGSPLRGDPKLGPLQDNGGPTLTHALLAGSPALSAATGICLAIDQRGVSRPQGSGCDLGAYEAEDTPSLDAAPQRTVLSSRTPTLNWNAVSWATGYTIQLSGSSTFSPSSYRQNETVTAEKLSYTVPSDAPLSEGVPYYWRVCAKRADGVCGSWSAVESFTVDVP